MQNKYNRISYLGKAMPRFEIGMSFREALRTQNF
ncbi:MAG: hypothetical protein ACJA1I_002082 [Zhongshania marina]|jgi:hypothetical protein